MVQNIGPSIIPQSSSPARGTAQYVGGNELRCWSRTYLLKEICLTMVEALVILIWKPVANMSGWANEKSPFSLQERGLVVYFVFFSIIQIISSGSSGSILFCPFCHLWSNLFYLLFQLNRVSPFPLCLNICYLFLFFT